MAVEWHWRSYSELERDELYAILALRFEVFVLEQKCVYQDIDYLDHHSDHLMGRVNGELMAYLRVIHPGKKCAEPVIGRVLIKNEFRDNGYATAMMQHAIKKINRMWPNQAIRLSAQNYLQKFYNELGFEPASDIYDDAGIPHIEMLRK